MKRIVLLLMPAAWVLCFCGSKEAQDFAALRRHFISGYTQLHIPEMVYDYHDYFSSIPSIESVRQQKEFFQKQERVLASTNIGALDLRDEADLEQMRYETRFNLLRLELEEEWIQAGRKIPENGLYSLASHERWYAYFIKKFTSADIKPEEVFALGETGVKRVKKEISRIQHLLGFKDSITFYRHLQADTFYLTSKLHVIDSFKAIDQRVRLRLGSFASAGALPDIYPIEWPDAGPNTPPGMYMNHAYNAYGKDVFQFNFYSKRYNKRAMEWLYMHEAIPGHHLQASIRSHLAPVSLEDLFTYPGNFEGWACYVEYFGKELGMYENAYSELGKWEWDLVRSTRLVLDVGIHYYGWSRERALLYWKQTVPAQDDIAEREVSRVTNWTAQALSYKVGAWSIFKMKRKWLESHPQKTAKDFHDHYLHFAMLPLAVIEKLMSS